MATSILETIERDPLAASLARALAAANAAAVANGTDPGGSLISISEDPATAVPSWRISYAPRDYLNRRGGGLVILVDQNAEVTKVLFGQ